MFIRNLIYILQSELYDAKKFLKFSYTHFRWWRLEKRAKLVWTKKASLIYVFTLIILFFLFAFFLITLGILGFAFLIGAVIFLPVIIILALWIIEPLDRFLKYRIFKKAQKFLQENRKGLTVISITGSYGKTTTRDILFSILREKFKVIKLSENINTDLGIANFILKNPKLFRENEIFIVEMGAYKKGEIRKICELVSPDYAILTGINQSHLERFGSLENIISAKFELPVASKKTAVLNFDDENIKKNYQNFKLREFLGASKNEARNVKFLDNFEGLEFEFGDVKFQTKLLAEHNITLILLASLIAQKLGMTLKEISQGVNKIDYVSHRLEPIYNKQNNVWVIDDSYNGNFDGIISGLAVLRRSYGRRIVLTPGLVELGEKTEEIHKKIGRLYATEKVDLILLIKSKAVEFIVKGLKENNFSNYKIYDSTEEAHAYLPNIIQSGDTIIFQNDLPDNYF